MNSTSAIIMAGGKGSRLNPLTVFEEGGNEGNMPKAVLPILGIPNIVRLVTQAAEQGITDFYLCEGYMAASVQQALRAFDNLEGINITHLVDPTGRNKPGLAMDIVNTYISGEFFWVLHTDVAMSHLPLRQMEENIGNLGTVGYVLRTYNELCIPEPGNIFLSRSTGQQRAKLGADCLDERGFVSRIYTGREVIGKDPDSYFNETLDPRVKKAAAERGANLYPVNNCCYLLSRKIFDHFPNLDPVSFDDVVFKAVSPGNLYGFIFPESHPGRSWNHIADLFDYRTANFNLLNTMGREDYIEGQVDCIASRSITIGADVTGPFTLERCIVLPGTRLTGTEKKDFSGCIIGPGEIDCNHLPEQRYSNQYIIPAAGSLKIGDI